MTITWHIMSPVSPSTGRMSFGASLTSVEGKLTLDEQAGTFAYSAQKKVEGDLAASREFLFNFTLKGEYKLADGELTLNIKEAENAPPSLIQRPLPVTLRYRRIGIVPAAPPKTQGEPEPIKSPLSDYLPLQGKWFEVVDDAGQQATSRYGRKIISFHRQGYTLEQTDFDEGIDHVMRGMLQLDTRSDDKPVPMKFQRIIKKEVTAYPNSGDPYPTRMTSIQAVLSGEYRIDGDRLSITIREIHQENEFVDKAPVTLEFERAPEATADTKSNGIPLSISKQVEMEVDIWKRLQGSWMEVEDFNPQPDAVTGRGGRRPTSLRFHKSLFTWQRFDNDEDLGKALAGSFRLGAYPSESSPIIEFNCESIPAANTEVMPSDEFGKYSHRNLSGPITLDGNQLKIRLTESTRPPNYLGELPKEWKFRRMEPFSSLKKN